MLTLQQLMRREVILGVVSELKTAGSMFQQFYGMLPGMPAASQKAGMDIGWDIFNNTRQLASIRPPMTGPATRQRQRIGHVSARAVRVHDSLGIFDNEVYQTRPIGGNYGEVDARGQGYIARQTKYLTDLDRNAREFMVANALQGGFGVIATQEDMKLTITDSGSYNVDMQIPATHKTYLDMGTGSNIITASWANAATDIVSHLGNLDAAFVRESGYQMRHCWMNGPTFFSTILQNTAIKNVGGTAVMIYQSFTRKEITGHDATKIDGGYDVVLKAWPHVTFHIYNQCLNYGTYADGVAASISKPIIPNNVAIFTPDPSPEWFGWVAGSELIRENVGQQAPREVMGFDMWATPQIDPSGYTMKVLDIGLPAIFVPNAVAVGTIVF